MAKNKSVDFFEFKKRALKAHGNKYVYDENSYKGSRNKIRIFCPIHGWFEQIVSNHIKGEECNLCGNDKIAKTLTYDKSVFLKKSNAVHGNKYDYSLVNYTSANDKVEIICPIHGIFKQTPANHWKGRGCPICGRHKRHDYGKTSKGELKINEILTKLNIDFKKQYEIPNENLFNPRKYMCVDFYLPKQNTIIEYNGEQHYFPVKFFGGKDKYNKQQERDMALRQYCDRHKIRLIEIPYWNYNNIETILKKELKKHKNKT